MLAKFDTLLAVLGCLAIVAGIVGVARYGHELSSRQATPAISRASDMPANSALRRPPLPPPGSRSGATDNPNGNPNGRDAFLLTLVNDASVITHGKEQYQMFCAACHGIGNIGDDSPSNLFNNRWVHGGSPADIETLIRNGYLDAGMPGWDGMLPDESIEAMVAYLLASQEGA